MATNQIRSLLFIIKRKERENYQLRRENERLTSLVFGPDINSFYPNYQIREEYDTLDNYQQLRENEWLNELDRQAAIATQNEEIPFEKDVYMFGGKKEATTPPPLTNQKHERPPKKRNPGNGASTRKEMDKETIQTLLNLLDVKDQEIRELKSKVEYFQGLYISLQSEMLLTVNDPMRNPGLMTEYEMEIQRLMQQNYELLWGPNGELPPIQGECLPYQEVQNGNNQTSPWLAYQEIQNNDGQAPPPTEEEEFKLPIEIRKEELHPSPSKASNKKKNKIKKWLTKGASSSGIKK